MEMEWNWNSHWKWNRSNTTHYNAVKQIVKVIIMLISIRLTLYLYPGTLHGKVLIESSYSVLSTSSAANFEQVPSTRNYSQINMRANFNGL